MLFQCWAKKKSKGEPMKYEFMFTKDGYAFSKKEDSMVINQEFQGFDVEEIDEEEE